MTSSATDRRLRDVLVVCTRNRPDDVDRCLRAVARCVPLPDAVLVVDSSDGTETEGLVARLRDELSLDRLRYLRAERGLTRQRNVGIRETDADVVHFIDDDTEPEPGYFGALVDALDRDPGVVAVGGRITNLGVRPPVRRSDLVFHLDGEEGTVLPSGRNVLVWTDAGTRRVQWLSGCSMSYRRSVLEHEAFDESLVGYALGEDLDMSTRSGRHGLLLTVPSARIVHHESPVGRWPDGRLVTAEVRHRYDRVRSGYAGERVGAFWWSVLGQVLTSLGRTATRQSRWELRVAWWTARASGSVLRESVSTRGQRGLRARMSRRSHLS